MGGGAKVPPPFYCHAGRSMRNALLSPYSAAFSRFTICMVKDTGIAFNAVNKPFSGQYAHATI